MTSTTPSDKRLTLRSLAANLVVLLVGVVLALLLLEVVLRVYNPLQPRIRGNRVVLVTNQRYHYRPVPAPEIDSVITSSINAIGFRGPNPPPDFARRLTIVAIGGSTTQCGLQPDDKTWPAHLGQELEKSFRDVWINDAGLAGHTTFGHLALLEDYVVRLHPRVALFLVGINDAAKAEHSDWDWDSENVRGRISFSSGKAFLKSLSAYSEVAALGMQFSRAAAARKAGLGFDRVEIAALGTFHGPPEAEQRYLATVARPEYLENYAGRLKRLIVVARAAGIEPVFLTQPLLVGPAVDELTGRDLATIQAGGGRSGKMVWDGLEIYNDITRRVCRENDALLIDVAQSMPKSSRYFFDFMHFNNQGTALVAQIIARSLCPELARRYPEFVTAACADSVR